MKRFHVNLTVSDLAKSVAFYTELFGASPTLERPDYAKWMLEDPRVNFSLSTHGATTGIDHVGLQAENESEFAELRERLARAEAPVHEQADVTCCYARSRKAWITDPDGVAWETFMSFGQSSVYGDGTQTRAARLAHPSPDGKACCSATA